METAEKHLQKCLPGTFKLLKEHGQVHNIVEMMKDWSLKENKELKDKLYRIKIRNAHKDHL